jgi:hypothetical protein
MSFLKSVDEAHKQFAKNFPLTKVTHMRTSIMLTTSNGMLFTTNPQHTYKFKQVYAGSVEYSDDLNVCIAYKLSGFQVIPEFWSYTERANHCNQILIEHIKKLKQNPNMNPELDTPHLRIFVGSMEVLG